MRYDKQIAVREFGAEGQAIIEKSTVAIVGCGALGSLQAELLVRMGIGAVRIADGDRVTIGNIHRQLLFTEQHAAEQRLKVEAAAEELRRINPRARIRSVAEFITAETIGEYVAGADLVLDALDDIRTRYLVNDTCLGAGIPWIYTGVAGTGGMVMPVIPRAGACLRCLYPDPPDTEGAANCLTSGILPQTVAMAVSIQLMQAVKILTGRGEAGTAIRFNCLEPSLRKVAVAPRAACPCRTASHLPPATF